jgi:ADP-ribose pyrophosphatase
MTDLRFPRVGVGGLIFREGNVLLQLRTKPPERDHWNIPGGKVEWGERIEDALLRELFEELGARFSIARLLCITDHIVPEDNAHWVSPAYLVTLVNGEPTNREPDQAASIKWFPLDALPSPLTLTASNAVRAFLGTLG